MKMTKTKWFLPAFCVALGWLIFAAEWLGGNLRAGLYSLAGMTVFGLLILVGGRSETVRGLRGDGRDERFRMIGPDGHGVRRFGPDLCPDRCVVCRVGPRGTTEIPYGQLLAIAGVAYLVGIAVIRFRG